MDIDFDFDSLSWTDELDHCIADVNLDLGVGLQDSFGTVPPDLSFAENESALPDFANHMHDLSVHSAGTMVLAPPIGQWNPQSMTPAREDPAPELLRSQLSLLCRGSYGDELVFKNCDSSKAMLLHGLSMEFGLKYSHDFSTGEVSIARAAAAAVSFKPPTPALVVTSPFQGIEYVAQRTVETASSTTSLMRQTITPAASTPPNRQLTRQLSRGQRITDSISRHVSTWKTSISKNGGRKGPLTEDGRRDMKVLEGAGGACWRCKVLRRKCDPGTPCKCCLQTAPMPHLGDDAPLWPLIGCRRGPLRDALPVQILCPAVLRDPRTDADSMKDDFRPRHSLDIADQCLLSAESQRRADMKAVLECASDKLSISDPITRKSFVSFVETGRYRNTESLQKSLVLEEESVVYSELIAAIGWELAENSGVLQVLEIKSWEEFMNMLEIACIYESEVGQTSLVMMSMVCLRHCLEALRLHSAGLLVEDEHVDCQPGLCHVQCIQDLSYYVEAFIRELSSVVFNKENMRDRRWWLSTFYSLCIQSYVRQALIAIETQLCFASADDVPAEDLTATQYLHLAAVLFTAASAKYDPLLGGRLQYAITESSIIPETNVPELHHSSARVACEVARWPEVGVKNSYQFLRKLLQIGSVDFEQEQSDLQPIRTSVSSGRLTPDTLRPSTGSKHSLKNPSSVYLASSAQKMDVEPPTDVVAPQKKQVGNTKRWSAETGYSMWSATSASNASSLSLARTFQSDVTSIHEALSPAQESLMEEMAEEFSLHEQANLEPVALAEAMLTGASLDRPMGSAAGMPLTACFVCHCCPRTPQRFRTANELTKHESEKPHPCTRCKRRFKSPAEADRHMKAVHIKSHYWTCKALEDPLIAFFQEDWDNGTYDICGFCGGGFLQGQGGSGGEEKRAQELISHLEDIHHYGECNREKEFYRVDNFRQHLKATHVAKQTKWLKELEARCRTSTAGTKNDGV
ncbi:hypothetical protein OQA88_4829 [Cercophora sp. LCS_1]